ncbi:cation-chloride cotransporter 1-like protein [Trifolium pratense]|uniref:Cation-chloride cotransporter 1-like protein n=1 Tax=Trifolium pratense TaxID=57577 RepID=A0A2K3NZ32_TRIPR|nr:cation-chloride cotransporter 1-like protein [Trifolium pratense]
MGDSDVEGGAAGDDGFHSPIGRKYRPVLANDRAVLEMSSIDPGSSSASSSVFPDQPPNLRKINVSKSGNGSSDAKDGNSLHQPQPNGPQQESKLELFGFDSLVNILGLKSMTGEQIAPPSSPRDGEDITITAGLPKSVALGREGASRMEEAGDAAGFTGEIALRPDAPKLGTMMGVFIPCVQSILGIIYYIRFSWIVGMAGIGETLVLVAMCGTCTFLTSISLSAIATNGAMKTLLTYLDLDLPHSAVGRNKQDSPQKHQPFVIGSKHSFQRGKFLSSNFFENMWENATAAYAESCDREKMNYLWQPRT